VAPQRRLERMSLNTLRLGCRRLRNGSGEGMPAVSEAQRRKLFATKGPAWMKAHHFDNKGRLPERVGRGAARREALRRMRKKKRS
jgi:hypothetical protein